MHAKISFNDAKEIVIVNADSYFESYVRSNPDYDACMYMYPRSVSALFTRNSG